MPVHGRGAGPGPGTAPVIVLTGGRRSSVSVSKAVTSPQTRRPAIDGYWFGLAKRSIQLGGRRIQGYCASPRLRAADGASGLGVHRAHRPGSASQVFRPCP